MNCMENNSVDVVLTSDRTLMSNYHNNQFLGFGTCAPSNFIPDVLYSYLFFPPLKTVTRATDRRTIRLKKN